MLYLFGLFLILIVVSFYLLLRKRGSRKQDEEISSPYKLSHPPLTKSFSESPALDSSANQNETQTSLTSEPEEQKHEVTPANTVQPPPSLTSKSPRVRRKRRDTYSRILFLDTETTGLSDEDRIVTLAAIRLNSFPFEASSVTLNVIHRIYNPERKCHSRARRVHGHSDELLSRQALFRDQAEEISEFIREAQLIVCHNAAFDLRFLNRELRIAEQPQLELPCYCTMRECRKRFDGSARLDDVIQRIGMTRSGSAHGAFEDAWLTMNLFLFLHNHPLTQSIHTLGLDRPTIQNLVS